MTIESDLKRIADSLEVIAKHLTNPADGKMDEVPEPPAKKAPPAPKAEVPEPPAPKAEVPEPPAKKAPPAPKAEVPEPPAPPAPETNVSLEELNAGLVEHYNRLGENREPIDKVMQEQFGVDTINWLDPADYGKLLKAVSEIPNE